MGDPLICLSAQIVGCYMRCVTTGIVSMKNDPHAACLVSPKTFGKHTVVSYSELTILHFFILPHD